MVIPRASPYLPIVHSEYDKRLDRLDRKGVEAAYVTRVGLLFQNWMTDTNKESQDRALRGHRNARKIYIEVMAELTLAVRRTRRMGSSYNQIQHPRCTTIKMSRYVVLPWGIIVAIIVHHAGACPADLLRVGSVVV